MDSTTLKIPQFLKIGFNARSDTYTGKLGFVIYKEGKTWRQEKSWEGWVAKEKINQPSYDGNGRRIDNFILNPKWDLLKPIEFENVPTSGFVLNKKVGGTRSSWNHRQAKCRVYDPRGFEFEINFENLLFILEESNSIKGKGLEGEFVYSWNGKDIVLLPCDSVDYQSSLEYNVLQKKRVKSADLIVGATYLSKKKKTLVYLGKHLYHEYEWSHSSTGDFLKIEEKEQRHAFYHIGKTSAIVWYKDLKDIGELIDSTVVGNFAFLMDELSSDLNYDHIIDLEFVDVTEEDFTCIQHQNYVEIRQPTFYLCNEDRYKRVGYIHNYNGIFSRNFYRTDEHFYKVSKKNVANGLQIVTLRTDLGLERSEQYKTYTSLQELLADGNYKKIVLHTKNGKIVTKQNKISLYI